LISMGGIRKPSYADFALLHRLGEERIPQDSSDVLVTRRRDGTLAIAAWNLVDLDKVGSARTIELEIRSANPDSRVRISRVDETHANSLAAYKAMGSPRYPTPQQVELLNRAAEIPPAENARLSNGVIRIELPVNGLALIEIPTK
jgi:xylan 1,4-beta-xylosidase